jgi:hypothetical protein
MHQDHSQWRAESNAWREDSTIWQHEIARTLKQVLELEHAFRMHADVLKRHAASIRLYEQCPAAHEHLLADYESGESPQALVEFAQAHQREADDHARQRERHEHLKHTHHRIMTKWRQLLSALAQAKPTSPTLSESPSTKNQLATPG